MEYIGQNAIFQASSLCGSKQGKLPLPTNQKENDDYVNAFITVLKKIGKPTNAIIPLDVNDIVTEGNFVTSTGQPVEWFNWREGEPNNFGLNEDHVEMIIFEDKFTESDFFKELKESENNLDESSSGKWNDTPGNAVSSYVGQVAVFCEYDQ